MNDRSLNGFAEKAEFRYQEPSFEEFRSVFEKRIESPFFGEKDRFSVASGEKSPGRKEIEKAGAVLVLKRPAFLRFAHRTVHEFFRLQNVQPEVRKISGASGKRIRDIRNLQMSLTKISSELTALDRRAEPILTFECRMHFDKAIQELKALQDALIGTEEYWASQIHPELRKKHDLEAPQLAFKRSTWPSLSDPPHAYGLESLKKKAAWQWLIHALDIGLRRRFQRARVSVSDTTRYRIIATLLEAAGLPSLSRQAIRAYFPRPVPKNKK